VQKTQQLSTMEALKTSTASVIHPAAEANQVQPRPVRNGMLGLALGLVLGLALALLRDALDTRVRGADEVSTRLHLPLLARLPAPPRQRTARDSESLVMLSGPYGEGAEPYRMLRTNLEFVNLNRGARVILFTSAVEREGKSTTVANLAILLARTGKHVVLVDLDLRRPYLDRVFGLVDSPGVTDVALGHAHLGDAVARIPLERPGIAAPTQATGQEDRGSLRVLPSGSLPPDPGDFVASGALERILREVGEGADIVLIDAPPLLHVGDAMTLSDKVDGVIVVVRLNLIRRQTLGELHRVLDGMPAAKLGFVLTGAGRDERYGYSGYYYQSRPVPQRPPLQLEDAVRAGGTFRARRRAARKAR
jgi:succinoglycan biosynthesis transport protein ExoP